MNQDLLNEAENRLSDWERKSKSWYITHYMLGILATVFVITAASKPPFIMALGIEATIIWLAAVFQGLNTYLLSIQKGAAYRAAWRGLKAALVKYKSNESKDPTPVVTAMEAGWLIIDKGYSSGGSDA
jgi:hypothetical protein